MAIVFPDLPSAETKTLKRVDDPIVMELKDFSALLGMPVNKVALMVLNGNNWTPIPFQIDQKKPDGSYCFTMGPEAGTDPDPDLDANDELVFMAKDTGDCAQGAGGQWPEGAKAATEIELIDPLNKKKAWAYMFGFSQNAPRSKEDYIKLEINKAAGNRKVITYEYMMGGPLDKMYPDFISAAILEDGSRGVDVLDRLKMRGKVILPLGLSVDYFLGDWTKSTDKGYIDGPVRVIHLAHGYLEIASYIKFESTSYSHIFYYVNHVMWPMTTDTPFDPLTEAGIIKEIEFYGYMDFCPTVYGSQPFSAANPLHQDVVFDGKMSEAEKNLDRQTPIYWNAGFGPQGALVSRLIFDPPGNVIQRPYYIDDATLADPPEDCPGVSGVGYKLEGMAKAQNPDTVTYQYYYYMSKLKPEDVGTILDILDHPIEVKVKAIASLN